MGKPAEALPHAALAASSHAAWGLEAHAFTLYVLGRSAEAVRVVDSLIERYGDEPARRLIWHALAGQGTENRIRALFATEKRAKHRAVFHEFFGDTEAALAAHEAAYEEESDNHHLLLAGLLALEQGRRVEARAFFARVAPEYARNRTRLWPRSFNRDLANAFVRQLDEGFDVRVLESDATKARATWIRGELNRQQAEYQGDIAFFLARFALAHGEEGRGAGWLREAVVPAVVSDITPLVARKLEARGESVRLLCGGTTK